MTADHVDARGAPGLTAVGGAGRLVDEADAVIATSALRPWPPSFSDPVRALSQRNRFRG